MLENSVFTVAVVGRPNVGKSTFFNKIVGKRLAIVDDTPGVTRDRKESMGNIGPYEFKIIDTAGLEDKKHDILSQKMTAQTIMAIESCDLVFFMIDGISGVLQEDKYYVKLLRKYSKPIHLLINKSENINKIDDAYNEAFKLGFGEPVCISAEHKQGFNDLIDIIAPLLERFAQKENDETGYEDKIQLSIIGRPNAGKSTLINALLNQERTITSDVAGTTRDAISIDWSYGNYQIKLIDTAGIRRKNKINSAIEKQSITDAENAINFSHVVVMMIDATSPLEQQDLSIIDYAVKEGRAIVIAINKWDKIQDSKNAKKEVVMQIERDLKAIGGVNIVYISALYASNLDLLMKAVIDSYKMWNKRIPTAQLNQWMKDATSAHPIPLNAHKRRPKIKFITQYKTRPPSFILHSNFPDDIDASYQRYLINSIRTVFDLKGVPIRFSFKKSDNPYHK